MTLLKNAMNTSFYYCCLCKSEILQCRDSTVRDTHCEFLEALGRVLLRLAQGGDLACLQGLPVQPLKPLVLLDVIGSPVQHAQPPSRLALQQSSHQILLHRKSEGVSPFIVTGPHLHPCTCLLCQPNQEAEPSDRTTGCSKHNNDLSTLHCKHDTRSVWLVGIHKMAKRLPMLVHNRLFVLSKA